MLKIVTSVFNKSTHPQTVAGMLIFQECMEGKTGLKQWVGSEDRSVDDGFVVKA